MSDWVLAFSTMNNAHKPYKLAVKDDDLKALKQKLALSRLPDELDDAGWSYGVPLADVRRLLARWQNGYDWRKHEEEINASLPQFTTDIAVAGHGTINIHYVHKKSENVNAIPLMFVHGWPGNFLEVTKILPLLIAVDPDNKHPSFHVVTFSLAGYGPSQATKKKGFSVVQYAEVAHKLMLSLGYTEYVAQGGDWGSVITRRMALDYGPKHVKAIHTNMPIAHPPSVWTPLLLLRYMLSRHTPAEEAGLERLSWFNTEGRGYFLEHSTQPQTLGYSLADSPVGLLAWIYEKLVLWTDGYKWEDDEVLTWVSIYWFSRAGPAASIRIYYETIKADQFVIPEVPKVPVGASFFPKDVLVFPKLWIRAVNNLVFEGDHESGGHFAAYEVPDKLVGDLRTMFGRGGGAYGVVQGAKGAKLDGYRPRSNL